MQNHHTWSAREMTALVVSGAVALFTIGYWLVQIVGVVEMLRLAYG